MSNLHIIALFGQHQHSRLDNAQTLLVAEKLAQGGVLYKKNIYWNMLINLPRVILFFIPVWLLIKHNDGFKDIEQCDAIVTCGRKMIRYAKHLKKHCCPDAKIIQIGNPTCDLRGVDVLLRPIHSRNIPHKNVINYRGYLSKPLEKEAFELADAKFSKIKEALFGPYISVFIGGNTALYKMTPAIAEDFGKTINTISNNMRMPLLICVDANVPEKIVDIFKQQLNCSYYFYYKKLNPDSPRVAFIGWGNYYILIGNSITDQSELILQKKPTYIYYAGNHIKKYKLFYNDVIADKCAMPLSNKDELLTVFEPVSLNDVDALIDDVIKKAGL